MRLSHLQSCAASGPWRALLLGAVLIAAGGLAALAPAGTGAQTPAVMVTLTEFQVLPSVTAVATNEVTFEVGNRGRLPHELVVVATSAAPGALPLDAAGTRVDESQVAVVGRVPEFGAGAPRTLTLDLAPGRYLLICNVPGHYSAGMSAAFSVAAPSSGGGAPVETPTTLPNSGGGGLRGNGGPSSAVWAISGATITLLLALVAGRRRWAR